jgi:hypothetical protein
VQAVEKGAEEKPDDDRREEGDDEDRADPETRVRAVLDVDRKRDRRE